MSHLGHIMVAGGEHCADVVAHLSKLGYRCSAAATVAEARRTAEEGGADVVLFDVASADVTACLHGLEGRRDRRASIMVLNTAADAAVRAACREADVDDLVEGPIDKEIIAARAWRLVRISTMRTELAARLDTARELGLDPQIRPADDDGEARVLLVADPGVERERLARALREAFETSSQADPFQAEALLNGRRFDAAVIVLGHDAEAAAQKLDLCRQIRRNSSLFNLPVLLVSQPGTFDHDAEPYRCGASVAAVAPADADFLITATDLLVRRQRRRWALRADLSQTLAGAAADSAPDVYSSAFLDAHLRRVLARAEATGRALTLATFSIRNIGYVAKDFGAGAAETLRRKVANWIVALVRAEDLVARLGDDGFSVVLADTAMAEAKLVVERLAAILHQTDFSLGEEVMEPVRVWLSCGAAAARGGDDPSSLLARARKEEL